MNQYESTQPQPAALSVDDYLAAGVRENTDKAYLAGTRHFEAWGGQLPSTSEEVARYLAHFGSTLSINTLNNRLAAVIRWHVEHGFDPPNQPLVKRVLKGIRTLHAKPVRQARPLQIDHLVKVAGWLDAATPAEASMSRQPSVIELRALRDRALVLLGFWRAFRGDELTRLKVEHIHLVRGQGMVCNLPRSKSDRGNAGTTYKVPSLQRCCPVEAVHQWITAANLTTGPLFPRIDQWGTVATTHLHPNSLIRVLRQIFDAAGLEAPEAFSAHSLRRGFAQWAEEDGWTTKELMEYVGWRDARTAMRYLDGAEPFGRSGGSGGQTMLSRQS